MAQLIAASVADRLARDPGFVRSPLAEILEADTAAPRRSLYAEAAAPVMAELSSQGQMNFGILTNFWEAIYGADELGKGDEEAGGGMVMKLKRGRFIALTKLSFDQAVSLGRRDQWPIIPPELRDPDAAPYSFEEALLTIAAMRFAEEPDGQGVSRTRSCNAVRGAAGKILDRFAEVLLSGEWFRKEGAGPSFYVGYAITDAGMRPLFGTLAEIHAGLADEGGEIFDIAVTNLTACAASLLARASREDIDLSPYFGTDGEER